MEDADVGLDMNTCRGIEKRPIVAKRPILVERPIATERLSENGIPNTTIMPVVAVDTVDEDVDVVV